MIEMILEIADRAARAALAHAKSKGLSITVSVVDEAGRLVMTMKGDGTGFLTPETSKSGSRRRLSLGRSQVPRGAIQATWHDVI